MEGREGSYTMVRVIGWEEIQIYREGQQGGNQEGMCNLHRCLEEEDKPT